eukprot:FR737067.1.p1 GENE.FR737067.1~~FR737067.1.p1  ORF type:complete len:146 (+),score=16.21 FR737067.1:126-563(+)
MGAAAYDTGDDEALARVTQRTSAQQRREEENRKVQEEMQKRKNHVPEKLNDRSWLKNFHSKPVPTYAQETQNTSRRSQAAQMFRRNLGMLSGERKEKAEAQEKNKVLQEKKRNKEAIKICTLQGGVILFWALIILAVMIVILTGR